jgi:hypothetical protein
MTLFFSLLGYGDKAAALQNATRGADFPMYEVDPLSFNDIPGSPFSYWASSSIKKLFGSLPPLHSHGCAVVSTNPLNSDFRYIRLWFEVDGIKARKAWVPWAKGGSFSPYYYDVHTVIMWDFDALRFMGFIGTENRPLDRPASVQFFLRPGLTWPRRTQSGLGVRAMPGGCIFSDKGPGIFVESDDARSLFAVLAITTSSSFRYLVELQMCFGSYEVGVVQQTPAPTLNDEDRNILASLAHRIWSAKRRCDTVNETSHAFIMPIIFLAKIWPDGVYIDGATAEIDPAQSKIDDIAFRLYGMENQDRTTIEAWVRQHSKGSVIDDGTDAIEVDANELGDEEEIDPPIADHTDALLSWAVGVAFGRFDIRLATGERPLPPDPDPFDSLPPKSPGMLPDDDPPFHPNAGILVDDTGHPHDLPHLINAAMDRLNIDATLDTRTWLRREFFLRHMRQYSKSRRKAPIYWPLSTQSGGYTLWLYYPALTDQTLFVAANDFVGVKLDREVEPALRALRQKTGRSREEERTLEDLQLQHDELRAFRDELLRLASTWTPNHDDGVQITAAPLWRLFRHRPWQTVLRDTWGELEQGAYDWAHLAMDNWPSRVREKCRTDRSLAIAHDLEHLCEPPPGAPGKVGRGRRKKG